MTKIGFVVHDIEGSAAGAIAEFQRPGAQLSATYVIAGANDPSGLADGELVQLLDNTDVCYAQAAGNWPPTAYNAAEVAGFTTDPMSPAQLATLERLIDWDAADRGYPVTATVVPHGAHGVTTHCNPDGSPDPAWGNHTCPGPIRLQQVATLLQGAPVPPAISPPITLSAPIVDWHLTSPFPAGAYLLTSDGAVFALGSATYHGGANGKPYFAGRTAAAFGALTAAEQAAGKVYVVLASSGERYAFP